MKLKIYILIAVLFLGAQRVSAQAQVVTGRVTESIGGRVLPISGVNVSIVNAQNRTLYGTVTTADGLYRLSIPDNEPNITLVYAFIGMETQYRKYTGQQTLDIRMVESVAELEDVVITTRRAIVSDMGVSHKEQVTATQRITMDAIMETSPVNTIEEALQGRLGGVDIITSGGDPGSRSAIRIRGTNTLNASAEPLIVIDGVPYTNDISDDFDFTSATDEDLGALLNISPVDIESIEVLKDAAATAIWGTKGGNGVLLINLKKGSKGKTNFAFNSKFAARIEPSTIPMLNGNQYTALMADAIWNSANLIGMTSTSNPYLTLLYNTPALGYDPDWAYFREYNQDTDWLGEIRRTGSSWENNFSMNGGGDKASYRFSLGHLTDRGTTIGAQLDRLTSSLSVEYQFSNRLRFGADFAYSQSNKDGNLETVRSEAFRKMPNKSPYWIDRVTGERTGQYFSHQTRDFEGLFTMEENKEDKAKNYNPIAMIHEGMNNTLQREGRITFRLYYDLLPGLKYSGYVSMNMKTGKTRKFIPQVATGTVQSDPQANLSIDALSENMALQTENKLIYTKNWNGIHNLIATGVLRTSQTQSSSYSSTTSGNGSKELSDPIIGANVAGIGSAESEVRSVSSTFLVNYTLMDRYIVQGSLTMDGNSAMGRSNRTGYFPTLGVSWNIQEEEFMRGTENWLDEVKLRASLGQSGKPPKGTALYLGAFGSLGEYMDMSAIYPLRMQLDKLKWETSTEWNIGTDLSFLHGKVRFTADYYIKTTKDLLQEKISVPSTTGYSQIRFFNSGEIRNKGWEVRMDLTLLERKDLRITSYFNVSRNRNEVLSLPENMTQENYSFGNGNYAVLVEQGRPVGSFYGYRYKGVYQNLSETYARDKEGNVMNDVAGKPIVMKNGGETAFAGDARYEDINNDGVINEYDIVYLGNYMPTLTGGAGVTVRYKQLTMNVFFHGRFGQKIVNSVRMENESMYNPYNQSRATLRRWRNEGDQTDIPRALYQEGYNYLGSDRFVEDASYLRLKELSFSYNLPRQLIQRWGLSQMNVFVTGYDLLTWTKYTGQDPEVSIPSKVTDLAKDKANTPVAIRFAAGLRLNF